MDGETMPPGECVTLGGGKASVFHPGHYRRNQSGVEGRWGVGWVWWYMGRSAVGRWCVWYVICLLYDPGLKGNASKWIRLFSR